MIAEQCNRAVCFAAGFFETKGAQSMVRAVALLGGVSGAICAVAAYDLAHRPHVTADHVAMVHALTAFAGVAWGGCAVALLARTRSNAVTPGVTP